VAIIESFWRVPLWWGIPLEPDLHRSGALFVRAFDRLLRGKAPAREVLANAVYLQFDAEFLLNELSQVALA
jgi:hypothetical protein